MSKEHSFDIVSEMDMQVMDNCLHQAMKEITARFDFKGTDCSIERADKVLTFLAADEMKLRAMKDILHLRMTKAGLSLKFLQYLNPEKAAKNYIRLKANIKQGLTKEDAKLIIAEIKKTDLKVHASIQGESVRVTAKQKDDLQAVIAALRKADLPVALQFTNYR
jgi:uncharacterized protein YajQ (UPF0234 family)